MKDYIFPIGLLIIILIGGRIGLQKLGILKTKEALRLEKEILKGKLNVVKFGLNPNLYKTLKGTKGNWTTKTMLNSYMKRFEKAFGIFNDNEFDLYQLFKDIPTQFHVSLFAHNYQTDTGNILKNVLKDKLSSNEYYKVVSIINSKPML